MKFKVDLGWIRIFTETSRRQIVVLAMIIIALLEIVNIFTVRYNHDTFNLVITTIATLAGFEYGRRYRRKRTNKFKDKSENILKGG